MSIQSPTKESQEAMQAKTQAIPPMNVGGGLPEGGTVGQVLTKTATGSEWADVPEELPTEGTAGQVLTKTADGCEWAAAAGGEPVIAPSGKGTLAISGSPHPNKLGSRNTSGTNDYLEVYSNSYTLEKPHKQGTISKVMLAIDSTSGYNYGNTVIYRTTLTLNENNADKFFPAATVPARSALTARTIGIFRKSGSGVGELHGNIDVELIGGRIYQITLRDPFVLWLTDVAAGSISLESFSSKAKINLETGPFVMFDSTGDVDASSNTADLGTWSTTSSQIAKYYKIME